MNRNSRTANTYENYHNINKITIVNAMTYVQLLLQKVVYNSHRQNLNKKEKRKKIIYIYKHKNTYTQDWKFGS